MWGRGLPWNCFPLWSQNGSRPTGKLSIIWVRAFSSNGYIPLCKCLCETRVYKPLPHFCFAFSEMFFAEPESGCIWMQILTHSQIQASQLRGSLLCRPSPQVIFFKIYVFLTVLGLSCCGHSHSCGVWASHWGGFSCGAWFLGQNSVVAPGHVGFSWTRDGTYGFCIGRWFLNHWTTRNYPR